MSGSEVPSSSSRASRSSLATSRSLLVQVKHDDPKAWERLVTLYSPLVYYWCRGWRLQAHDAADVVQEVFQSVATRVNDFRKERTTDTFRGWLRTITRNKVYDHFRRVGRQPAAIGGTEAQGNLADVPAEIDNDDPSSNDVAERTLLYRGLELIRSEFAERTWQAFWRTTVDGLAAAEAAAELSMTAGAVRVAKSRVLQRLRAELGDLIDE